MYDTIKAVENRCSLSVATATYKLFPLFRFPPRRYPLRRGSSFTFLTPGPQWDFTLVSKTAGGFISQKHANKSRNTEVKVPLPGGEGKSTHSSLPD